MKKHYMGIEKLKKFPKVPTYWYMWRGEGMLAPTHLGFAYIESNRFSTIATPKHIHNK